VYDADLNWKFTCYDLEIKEMIEVDDTYYCELKADKTPRIWKDNKGENAQGNHPSKIV